MQVNVFDMVLIFILRQFCSFLFRYILDGVRRMRERPIRNLVVGLKQLGADVECMLGTNCPPVCVNANGGLHGGKVSLTFSCNLFILVLVGKEPLKFVNLLSIFANC